MRAEILKGAHPKATKPRTRRGGPMARKPAVEPRRITPDSIDPKHRWDRPIQAPGRMQVDFEERVDFRRLHAYRLGRTRRVLAQSGLGAGLGFDQDNIRYLSGTLL